MLIAIFLSLLLLATGAGCPVVTFDGHVRRKTAKRNWQWRFVKNTGDAEHFEAMTMSVPLTAGVQIISGAVAVFLIRLLA
jgi:hypothetical protein